MLLQEVFRQRKSHAQTKVYAAPGMSA